VLASERPPERDSIERAAQARGLPLAWPAQALDVAAARARLSAPGTASRAILIGIASAGPMAWSFGHLDARAQAQGSAATGADLAADTLAARYAPASTRSVNTVLTRVSGVANLQDYAALLEYLQTLSLVRDVAVAEVAGSTVRLELAMRGDLELLKAIAALDTHLAAGARADPASGDQGADFIWQP